MSDIPEIDLCPTCRVFGTMIPHATAVSPRSLRIAMVRSSLNRLSMMQVRGPRGHTPTGGLTSCAAVDMSPIAVPVDDEFVVTNVAPEYQSLQPNLDGAENWTFDPAGLTLGPDQGAPRPQLRRGLGGGRALSHSTPTSLASLQLRRHFSTWLHRQAGRHTHSQLGSAPSPNAVKHFRRLRFGFVF